MLCARDLEEVAEEHPAQAGARLLLRGDLGALSGPVPAAVARCSSFPKLSEALWRDSGIGTSSGGRCMRPDAPFFASSCARPAAALRDHAGPRVEVSSGPFPMASCGAGVKSVRRVRSYRWGVLSWSQVEVSHPLELRIISEQA